MITWSTDDKKIASYLIKNGNHFIGVNNDDRGIKFEFEVLGKLCADIDDYYGDSGPDSFREWIKKITAAYNECLAPQEEGDVSNENI